jgi:monoamine oxidase
VTDVIVVGAGLAGLAAARDLVAGGADVVVLEARPRAGGRVEQTTLSDGRPVQLGGEVIGLAHTAYRALVEELGLTIEPGFPGLPGADTHLLADGTRHVVDGFGWLGDEDRRTYARVEEVFGALARTVDPDDPWSHPDAARLDALSVGAWLRSEGATAEVVRARELAMAALAGGSVEQTSLLADLRKEAAVRAAGFYDYEVWESHRVAEGSAEVALRMAAELGSRLRLGAPVTRIRVGAAGCTVTTANGERFDASAVVCAVPVGPLRAIHVDGVSDERLASLRRQRHAPAAKIVAAWPKSFWEDRGQNGSAYFEREVLGGAWAQREGILSALVPAERLGWFLATDPEQVQSDLTGELARAFGPEAARPEAFYVRNWALDPWTQGYITGWRPGDVMAVGPLHGTHEPPFYVCGSDQWVCGYMEGAVRTGRGAAASALGRDPR